MVIDFEVGSKAFVYCIRCSIIKCDVEEGGEYEEI